MDLQWHISSNSENKQIRRLKYHSELSKSDIFKNVPILKMDDSYSLEPQRKKPFIRWLKKEDKTHLQVVCKHKINKDWSFVTVPTLKLEGGSLYSTGINQESFPINALSSLNVSISLLIDGYACPYVWIEKDFPDGKRYLLLQEKNNRWGVVPSKRTSNRDALQGPDFVPYIGSFYESTLADLSETYNSLYSAIGVLPRMLQSSEVTPNRQEGAPSEGVFPVGLLYYLPESSFRAENFSEGIEVGEVCYIYEDRVYPLRAPIPAHMLHSIVKVKQIHSMEGNVIESVVCELLPNYVTSYDFLYSNNDYIWKYIRLDNENNLIIRDRYLEVFTRELLLPSYTIEDGHLYLYDGSRMHVSRYRGNDICIHGYLQGGRVSNYSYLPRIFKDFLIHISIELV